MIQARFGPRPLIKVRSPDVVVVIVAASPHALHPTQMAHHACITEVAFGLFDRPACSDPGDDLNPSLVHRLEPLSFLLRILVWYRADEVVTPAVLVDLARVSLVALINWTYLSQEVDLGSANDHGKSTGSDPPITRFPDIILIKKSPTIGDSLSRRGWSCGRDQFNTRAGPTADLDPRHLGRRRSDARFARSVRSHA